MFMILAIKANNAAQIETVTEKEGHVNYWLNSERNNNTLIRHYSFFLKNLYNCSQSWSVIIDLYLLEDISDTYPLLSFCKWIGFRKQISGFTG